MKKISGLEFQKLLYKVNGDGQISNFEVEIENVLIIELDKLQIRTNFLNLKIYGGTLKFINKNSASVTILNFNRCDFFCRIYIDKCNLFELNFVSNKFKHSSLLLISCKIKNFKFNEGNIFEIGDLEIHDCEFESSFKIDYLKYIESSKLRIFKTIFNSSATIIDSEINQLAIKECVFNDEFVFFRNKLSLNSPVFFIHCMFNNSTFYETKFNNNTHFVDCKFLNVAEFENTGEELRTVLRFHDCEFLKQVSFNKSRIHKILFSDIKFYDIVSFQETNFGIVEIDRTSFEKQAYFDDIQINQIDVCNRKTIRTIKQQLQKAENRIDFNRFKNYEMALYYKELSWKNNFIDKSILWATKVSTDFGNSWIKAFWFTIKSGIAFYLLFFLSENYNHSFDFKNISQFISGLFRFFLVTDFYNPLETDRIYLTKPLSWLIFIFGKIVIAFGIYEMIQSFRKFKA